MKIITKTNNGTGIAIRFKNYGVGVGLLNYPWVIPGYDLTFWKRLWAISRHIRPKNIQVRFMWFTVVVLVKGDK